MRLTVQLAAMVIRTIFLLSSRSMTQEHMLDNVGDASIESFNVTEYIYKFLNDAVEPLYQPKSSLNVEDAIRRISKLERAFDANFRNLEMTFENQTEDQDFQLEVKELRAKYLEIYDSLRTAMKYKARLDRGKLNDPDYFTRFAENVITYLNRPSPLMGAHHIIRSDLSARKPLLITFIEEYQNSDRACLTRMSPSQAVNLFLRHLKLVSAETFSIMSISYEILEYFSQKKNETRLMLQIKYAADDIVGEYTLTVAKYKDYLTNVSQGVYACSSKSPPEGNAVGMFQRGLTLMYFIPHEGSFHQIKMLKKVFHEECQGPFSSAQNAEPYRSCQNKPSLATCCRPTTKEVCSISRSCVKKLECQSLADTRVCLSESTEDRRYEYYHPLGKRDMRYCKTPYDLKRRYYPETQLDPANRTECSPIECTCEEGDYWISLMPAFSRFEDGMVITGAKLILEDNTLFMVIQEGELLPNGFIRENSTQWRPKPAASALFKEKITWKDLRTIELSKNVLASNLVMTGLGFNKRFYRTEDRIHLDVYSSPHSFNTSRRSFNLNEIHRLSPLATIPTEELILVDPDVPTKGIGDGSKMMRVSDRIVKFTTSNGDDGGQSTVPFIDTQEVEPNPPTPLSGAGLYFRGHENSGGFIGLELLTYDFLPLTYGDLSDAV